MSTLSTLEIAQLRSDASAYLPDTCTIQVPTNTIDAIGGWSTTWANTYTSVACRLAPMLVQRGEALVGSELAAITVWVLTIAYNQAIDETMRVVHDSETYEVSQMQDTESNRTAKRIYLRRMD